MIRQFFSLVFLDICRMACPIRFTTSLAVCTCFLDYWVGSNGHYSRKRNLVQNFWKNSPIKKHFTVFIDRILVSQDRNWPKHVVKNVVLVTQLKDKQTRCFPRSDWDLEFFKPLRRQCLLYNLCAESVMTKMTFHIWVSKPCSEILNVFRNNLNFSSAKCPNG